MKENYQLFEVELLTFCNPVLFVYYKRSINKSWSIDGLVAGDILLLFLKSYVEYIWGGWEKIFMVNEVRYNTLNCIFIVKVLMFYFHI